MYCRGPVAATIGVLFLLFHYIEVVKGVLPPYVMSHYYKEIRNMHHVSFTFTLLTGHESRLPRNWTEIELFNFQH